MKSVRPKKFLGQHFLKDLGVARAIADTVDACPNLPVLEVGPGMGVLTQFLLPKGREVKVAKSISRVWTISARTSPSSKSRSSKTTF